VKKHPGNFEKYGIVPYGWSMFLGSTLLFSSTFKIFAWYEKDWLFPTETITRFAISGALAIFIYVRDAINFWQLSMFFIILFVTLPIQVHFYVKADFLGLVRSSLDPKKTLSSTESSGDKTIPVIV